MALVMVVGLFAVAAARAQQPGDQCPGSEATRDPCADVAVSMTAPAAAYVSERVIVELRIRNNGPQASRDVSINVAGFGLTSVSCPSSDSCGVSSLATGEEVMRKVEFEAASAGPSEIRAEVRSLSVPDPDEANNVALARMEVRRIPLGCPFTWTGTAGADTRAGGRFGDRLVGLGGADLLLGGEGTDCLVGGDGDDRLSGGPRSDTLKGGSGNDALRGGSGADKLVGGSGEDRLLGGSGSDSLHARDRSRDVVDCGAARDVARVDRRDRVLRCERVLRR